MRAYSSGILLRDTVKRQNVFDTARWKYTRHLMTEKISNINGNRVSMTEIMMEEVLIDELESYIELLLDFNTEKTYIQQSTAYI